MYVLAAVCFYIALVVLPVVVVIYMVVEARQRRQEEIANAIRERSLPSARVYQPAFPRRVVLHPEEGAPLRLAVKMVVRNGARRTRQLVRGK